MCCAGSSLPSLFERKCFSKSQENCRMSAMQWFRPGWYSAGGQCTKHHHRASSYMSRGHWMSTVGPKRLRTHFYYLGISANEGLPLPLGRGVCETKSKLGRSRPRKPFSSRVFCAQRGIETMVSGHGLGRGQAMW